MVARYCRSGRLALPGPLAGLTMTMKVISGRERKLGFHHVSEGSEMGSGGDVRIVRRLPRRVVGGIDVQREDDRGRRGPVPLRETDAEADGKGDEQDDGGDDCREPGPEPRGVFFQPMTTLG
jgi:hypothetical protein